MKTYIHILIALAFTVGMGTSDASGRMQIDNLGIMSGLSDGDIMSIAQDSHGLIWVATANGLNRFDGSGFINYTTGNSGLGSNALNCVVQLPDDPKRLWIGTQRDGLYYYDQTDGNIRRLENPVQLSVDVTSISPASGGGMWVNYYNFGPQYINPLTGESRDCTFHRFPGLPRICWDTAEGADGILYVGHAGEGFSIVDTLRRKVETFRHSSTEPSIPGNEVYSVCVDKDGNVWLGTDKGAALYMPTTRETIPFVHDDSNPKSILPGRIRHINQDMEGNIWFASTLAGVCVLPAESVKTDGYRNACFSRIPVGGWSTGTSNAYVRTIYPDSFGNIWIGNYRTGVDVINHEGSGMTRVEYTGFGSGMSPYLPAWDCEYSADGTLWVGGENEVAAVKGGSVRKYPLPSAVGARKSFVKALKCDSNGKLWVGTYDRGVFVLDPADGMFTSVADVNPDVKTFAEDPSGNILIGTDKGVYMCPRGIGRAVPLAEINSRLGDLVVQAITIDSHDRYWIGTFGRGLYVFDKSYSLLANIKKSEGLPSNAVSDILHDASGKVWVATRGGVIVMRNPEILSDFMSPDCGENGSLQVRSLQEDEYGNIWISSTEGIGRISPDGHDIKFYRSTPSLPMHTFMEGASAKGAGGKLYFASSNGVFEIDPAEALRPHESMSAQVTDFYVYKAGSESSDNIIRIPFADGKVELTHDMNTFSVTFSVPDYARIKTTEFEARLEGFDKGWTVPATEGNRILCRNVPPGTYRLFVRQRRAGQDWENPECILTVKIDPPLWLSWWAKTAYVVAVVALILFFMKLYRNKVRLRQHVAALEESNRNRQELNEERLRFYTNVTHELRTPLTLILGPLEDIVSDPRLPQAYSGKLQMMRNSASQLLYMINAILEFRKTETHNRRLSVKSGNLPNLLREIGLSFKELCHNPEVEVALEIDDDSENTLFDREILTVILNNIMINAVKYTRKGTITLSCRSAIAGDRPCYEIKVADTGYGISRDKLPHIFERYYQANDTHQASGTGIGLAIVKNLIEIHKAEIEVESDAGKGTVFTVRIFKDNIYPEALHAVVTDNSGLPDGTACKGENDGRTKVLVVEDNPDLCLYIRRCLESDFNVVSAGNGLEGLRSAHEEMPDIIITDIMMPDMDGIEMCRAIKEDILTSHIPVIMLTAKDSESDRQEGYEAGAISYLTKPFSSRLLLSRVNNILRLQREMAQHLRSLSIPDSGNNRQIPSQVVPGVAEVQDVVECSGDNEKNILSPLDREFLEKIMRVVNENISNPELGVVFIADKMCMSNSTLYRKVMAVLGVSTNEYIRRVRLRKASELLVEGKLSITDIAFETGFGTHSSFAKAFKKEFGMTASEYVSAHKGTRPTLNVEEDADDNGN